MATPLHPAQAEWGPTRNMPPEIARLVERLRAQQGIQDVLVMRQATEVHLVAQELQVGLHCSTSLPRLPHLSSALCCELHVVKEAV